MEPKPPSRGHRDRQKTSDYFRKPGPLISFRSGSFPISKTSNRNMFENEWGRKREQTLKSRHTHTYTIIGTSREVKTTGRTRWGTNGRDFKHATGNPVNGQSGNTSAVAPRSRVSWISMAVNINRVPFSPPSGQHHERISTAMPSRLNFIRL